MENFQLITLFQQSATSTTNKTGYKYKLETGANIEIDIPFSSFTTFIDGLMSHIYSITRKYDNDRKIADEGNVSFDPSAYSGVVLEKIDKSMIPIIVDVNFEFNNTDDRKFYHDKFIYMCLHHLQGIILSLFKVPPSEGGFNKLLTCFVLESDPSVKGEKLSSKIRFHFPYAKVNIEHLNKIFIRRFRDVVAEENLIRQYVIQTPTNGIDRIIPDIGEYICLPGCKQTADDSPFLLRNVYSYVEDPNNLDNDYQNEMVLPFYVFYQMAKEHLEFFEQNSRNPAFMNDPNYNRYSAAYLIEPLNNSLVRSKHIDIDFLDKYQRTYNLPLMLSVHYSSEILQLDSEVQLTPDLSERQSTQFNEGAAINSNPKIDKRQMLAALLPMIGKHRFTEYYKYDWKAIGKAIHSIYSGTKAGLDIWKSYTIDPEMHYDCDFLYDNFNNEILNIVTIRHYANVDNMTSYNAWNRTMYFSKIEQALSLQEIDFIEFAIHILCIKFVYDRNDGIWYFFDGVRLRKDKGACVLIDHLRPVNDNAGNDMIMRAIFDYQDEHRALSRNDKTRLGKSQYDGIEKQVSALIRAMSGLKFLNKIVKALEVYMFDDNLRKIDENPDTMGCENCIIECIDDRIITREGKLQDYVTMSTNIYFPHGFTIDTPKVRYMFKYYGQVHTDPELCHHFLKMKGSLMRGGNAEKQFWNLIGKSNGSKSQVVKFMQAGMGDYCVIVSNGSFTLNINANANGPDPFLEKGRNAHAWILAETDRSEKWHAGHIKKHTSGDDYNNRTLNKEGGLKKALHQLIAMSNIDLDCPGADEAYYARYIKIPFLSKFVDNAPSDEVEQYRQRRFPIDQDFSNKISVYAQADLWISFYYYSIYKKEGIRSLPLIVKHATMKYQRDMDVIFNFIIAKCLLFWIGDPKEKIPDMTRKVSLYDLHRAYVVWYQRAYGRETQPLDQFKFRDDISDRISEVDEQGYFSGIELRPDPKMLIQGGGVI